MDEEERDDMIRIFLGNLGSGKSASAVREMANDLSGRVTYTNLMTKGIRNVMTIRPQDVIKKIPSDDGKKVKYDLNVGFWSRQEKPLNILWDEIHLTANSRMSMSKVNMIMSRFIAMGRRITGFDKRGYGSLTFIAQKERTIDQNIKELTNEIIYHIGHWILKCNACGSRLAVNSEMRQVSRCIRCASWDIEKRGMFIERLMFRDWEDYWAWDIYKGKSYVERTLIQDIERYFKFYDTMQIENMWEDYLAD